MNNLKNQRVILFELELQTLGYFERNYKLRSAAGKYFTAKGITQVPRILECGQGLREVDAPLCRNVDLKGATTRLKWFKYTK